jgi:hypothetical protein
MIDDSSHVSRAVADELSRPQVNGTQGVSAQKKKRKEKTKYGT